MNRSALRPLAAGTALGLVLGSWAFAEENGAAPAEVLDTVTVSATKRDQDEGAMPVAATILQADQIPLSTLDPGAEIARQSPTSNFVDLSRAGEAYMTMRGVATLGSPLNTLDNTVGFSVDGVPTSLSGLAPLLMDVERVEVLRGPQGTAFGRNALAGGINVVTMPADGYGEARLDAETGSDGYSLVQALAGGWLVPERLAGRAVVRYQEFDGDIPNIITGKTEGGADIAAARASLRFTPGEAWTIDLTGGYGRDERDNPAYLLVGAPGFPVSASDTPSLGRRTIGHGTLTVARRFENFTLTSVTGYQDIDILNAGDFSDTLLYGAYLGLPGFLDFIPAALFTNPDQDKIRTAEAEGIFTQEIRANAAKDAPVQWVAGLNYFRSAYEIHRDMKTLLFAVLNGKVDNRIDSETLAGFADLSVPLFETWVLSGGIRIARDEQAFEGRYRSNGYPGTVAAFDQRDEAADTYVTGRVALSRHWADTVMTYASIAWGYASGGFERLTPYAAQGVANTPFRPARAMTVEAGIKAGLLPGLRLDASLFHNDVTDGQLASFDPDTVQIFFANQDYRSYGFEASLVAEPVEGLVLRAGAGFTETRQGAATAESAAAGAARGNKVPMVPTWTVSLGLDYRLPAAGLGLPGAFLVSADYQYVGSRQTDAANSRKLDPYAMVNARLGWAGEHLGFYAFGRNLLDSRPISFAAPFREGVTGAYVGRGRVLGLGMSVAWQGDAAALSARGRPHGDAKGPAPGDRPARGPARG
ncbi:TonB-dependent receptor [Zavarzinia compransoris]|uniref:TonB-dependent receptor n=1 Tax=Zavarzinia compransoris TaxID=1264899 RepID=A0A317E642_9PROT|nr:TonB-dependent receptor [Zavarzinia compransoris]PWR21794.1 TonB-dependent receptor [Zavarzinia compransoris]TDP45406.1 iron complex outermembrane receptor protein [Zavarzinia compransoris]